MKRTIFNTNTNKNIFFVLKKKLKKLVYSYMPGRNLFRKPFDDGTKTKLALFENYLLEWLPVFLSPQKIIWPTVNVFDFFAGEGYDSTGTKGSPIIILDNIKKYKDFILRKELIVNVHFNEFDKGKFETLVKNLEQYGIESYTLSLLFIT